MIESIVRFLIGFINEMLQWLVTIAITYIECVTPILVILGIMTLMRRLSDYLGESGGGKKRK